MNKQKLKRTRKPHKVPTIRKKARAAKENECESLPLSREDRLKRRNAQVKDTRVTEVREGKSLTLNKRKARVLKTKNTKVTTEDYCRTRRNFRDAKVSVPDDISLPSRGDNTGSTLLLQQLKNYHEAKMADKKGVIQKTYAKLANVPDSSFRR